MWDEKNDNKIRDAADNFQPAFDPGAWQKMEQLLDKNLPQKKDRKRLFLLLPFLFILLGFFFFIFFYHRNDGNWLQSKGSVNPEVSTYPAEGKPANEKAAALPNPVNRNRREITATGDDSKKEKAAYQSGNGKVSKALVKNTNLQVIKVKGNATSEPQNGSLNPPQSTVVSIPAGLANSDIADKRSHPSSNPKGEPQHITAEKSITHASGDKNRLPANQQPGKPKAKKKESFANDFSLSFSAGPGVSSVGRTGGKLSLDFGISAGYLLSRHFGIRTGIFMSKKIYSATPEQYNLSVTNFSYLDKINANCNVIDIPFNVDYFSDQKGKHNWFFSAGLSSYLMKKESYDYVYKMPGGQLYNKDWTIWNQNEHFFSILDLSAGYQYFLNGRFSLAVQPYIDLPLTGIGAGKVKLNSAGILFSVKVKPFLKRTN